MNGSDCGVDWRGIDLVVFDMDGTLYDQRRLRVAMALRLAWEAARTCDPMLPRTLSAFRRCREELGDRGVVDFAERQYALCAERCGRTEQEVRAATAEWIERRPLPLLRRVRARAAGPLLSALSATGRTVAVLSDYPARDKLAALGLRADIVVSAGEDGVGLKPDPAGVRRIMAVAGATPARTMMVGDRFDRDWEAARRAGTHALIRSRRRDPRCPTFRHYDDPLFQSIRREAAACG